MNRLAVKRANTNRTNGQARHIRRLIAVLKGMVRADAQGTYPLFHIADAISEVNRATPGQGGDLLPQDYQALLQISGQFLIDQRRGMQRFIDIVRSRCLPGSSSGYCPK